MYHSLTGQLLRWLALLCLTLVVLHHSPTMVRVLAGQATDAGCHSGGVSTDIDHRQHHAHHQSQAHDHHQHSHH